MTDSIKPYAELEIGLQRISAEAHRVELRFTNPLSEAEVSPVTGEARFDLDALADLELDLAGYGKRLSSMLFADGGIAAMFGQVQASVQSQDLALRVRLLVGPSAPELHALRWELLAAPAGGAPMFTSERVLFSRFMTSQDWRTVKLRPRSEMKALIAVSAPANLDQYRLAAVDLPGEVARASGQLVGMSVAVAGREQPLTLKNLLDALREPVDLLYLVCHGGYTADGPHLYLQKDDGTAAVVKGQDLAHGLADLSQQPRLMVMASCESAAPDSASLPALAPMLAEAGVSAIVGMRGKITLETVKQIMPVFFRELLRDGQIDRAMAAARAAAVAQNRPDYWIPALYLRLRGGRIWYDPGFGPGDDFEKWQSIVTHVRDGNFVAITGLGARESITGDSRNVARALAKANHFPLAAYQCDDLPQVLQFLTVTQDADYALSAALAQIREETLRLHAGSLPPELANAPLPKIFDALMEPQSADQPKNVYQMLAELPGSVYVTASADTLMAKALKLAGKKPQLLCNHWRRTGDAIPVEPPYDGTPAPETPVVYQMLGVFSQPDTLVLTENDYFDYTIATAGYKLMPRVVRSALASSSLLFLGFQLTDWSFRVLFRLIQSLEGGSRRARMSHVGVQVNPDEYTMADVDKARRYLQKYFDQEGNVGLYWGSAEDFLKQLHTQLASLPQKAAAAAAGDGWDV
jgi:hypothetical protein